MSVYDRVHYLCLLFVFFFFKQKTAYELRISDWSSDVCSSDLLNVHRDVLDTFGAVSIAVAWAMAQGALARSNADVAVAITGIAGPDGGSEKKPVGTVVFARARRGADPKEVIADLQTFEDRGRARKSTRLNSSH